MSCGAVSRCGSVCRLPEKHEPPHIGPNVADPESSVWWVDERVVHCYDHADGERLIMRCGAVSQMPETSAPYVDTRRAFEAWPPHEACQACRAALLDEAAGRRKGSGQ